MSNRLTLMGTAIALLGVVPIFAARQTFLPGPSFQPDSTLMGSSLSQWRTVGAGKWEMSDGHVIGTPGPAGAD